MATQTQATIQIPLDIPNVKVLRTEVHPGDKLVIWVESEVETVPCGICGRELHATLVMATRFGCVVCLSWGFSASSVVLP